MDFPKIHESEYRFCLIMWEYEPVTAVQLVSSARNNLVGSEPPLIQLSSALESVAY